ncbi:MAG: class I SAM-dependent methyltransferase [Planctomycetota bacterium]|nr:MAG: class I SAM-dependent methyltransferase [Planctomycetota bacterium]
MGVFSDLKILYHMVMRPGRGKDHAERLESFYAGQAEHYDEFRKRLLQGREDLWKAIGVPADGVWVDVGAGTGSNAEYFGDRIGELRKLILVDLSRSLLKVADRRIEKHGWKNVVTQEADATVYRPDEPVDVVTFSYSLTMIPDWFAAIDNAVAMLKPGGKVGVVDFYVSRKHPEEGMRRHRGLTRLFWTGWFNYDNVFPSPDHIPYLKRRLKCVHLEERKAKVPYLPLVRAPYYIFIGEKVA